MAIPGVLEREHGWPMFLLWHSIYPWLASDLGFEDFGQLDYEVLGRKRGKRLQVRGYSLHLGQDALVVRVRQIE